MRWLSIKYKMLIYLNLIDMPSEYEKSQRFSGMRTNPYKDTPKNAIRNKIAGKKRKVKATNGDVSKRKGLSEYQLKNQEEFMKVRPGETQKEWSLRTRFRRIRTEEEIALTKRGKRAVDKLQMRMQKSKKPFVQLFVLEKDFNFLKYYIFINNWATVKFNIPQKDLEIGFHFYENIYFTREEFENKCRLFCITQKKTFFRFKREGYIVPNMSRVNNDNIRKETGVYKLSKEFINILTKIYHKIAYQEPFDFKPNIYRTIPVELEETIIEMAKENEEIISGRKEPDKIIIHKENEDRRYKKNRISEENS
jgi:hypothetical protein